VSGGPQRRIDIGAGPCSRLVAHRRQVPANAAQSLRWSCESLGWRPLRLPNPCRRSQARSGFETVHSLDCIYRRVARPWTADELADRHQAAYRRGSTDLPAGEPPPERPITLLATAVPRLISLAVASNVLHVLPDTRHQAGAGVAVGLLATIDATATGSLHRCQLALEADGRSRGYHPDEWLPLAYEQTAEWLEHASPTSETPALVEHAQQAGRLAALAIGALDRDIPSVPEAIADCIAHLLVVCVLADEARQNPLA
jgi:hypothetical protein